MTTSESPLTLAGYMPTRAEYDRALAAVRALTEQLAAVTAERDAARAEVARLTAALETMDAGYRGVSDALVDLTVRFDAQKSEVARLTAALKRIVDNGWIDDVPTSVYNQAVVALYSPNVPTLRGDTAPERTVAEVLTPEIPVCTCEHVMDGDDVAYTIRDKRCPVHTAPATAQRHDASDDESFGPAFAPAPARVTGLKWTYEPTSTAPATGRE